MVWVMTEFSSEQQLPALRELQEKKFQGLLREVIGHQNGFYLKKWQDADVSLDAVRGINDIDKLPFTTKFEIVNDQKRHPPYGTNLTYPLTAYVRMHQTSGTTGQPLRWLDTATSWSWLLHCWGLIYDAVDLRSEDRIFLPFSFGPFIGFWGAFEGALARNNFCLSGGGMSSRIRLQCIVDHKMTVIACTPTYARRLLEVAKEQGVNLRNSAVRALIVAGEPGGNVPSTRRELESGWGARVFDHTGMTEIGASGVECTAAPGGVHLLESEFVVEVINPDTGRSVQSGEMGELVVTNLGRWGSPLIRYRTGDLVITRRFSCDCGRDWLWMEGGILGRVDDMLLIRGNNVYPSAVEEVIRRDGGVAEYRVEVVKQGVLPQIRILVEPFSDFTETDQLGVWAEKIGRSIQDALSFRPEVQVVPRGSLPRFELKADRWIRQNQTK